MSTVLALALISVFSNHPAYVSPVMNQFFFSPLLEMFPSAVRFSNRSLYYFLCCSNASIF